MNKNIIYLKEVNNYDDILKNKNNRIPLFIKKTIYLYKNIFNIITKKNIEGNEIWILPIKEKYSNKKVQYILRKKLINEENIYLATEQLRKNQIEKYMQELKIKYITEEKIKKLLIRCILKYISNLQKKEMSNLELTILVNNTSNINMYLIEELAKQVKGLKIVSLYIYKFKRLEEALYNEYGIPIQFSNSYKKSLEKSQIIINLDFNEIELNEYEIFNKAIIINCIKDNIKIKSRLFNGIIVNSCNIEFNNLKDIRLYESYKNILIYASLIENEENISKIYCKMKEDNMNIINLIGNSGIINKNEFKNIVKKLDKNIKT